jgi:hypothetical protein
MSEIRTMDTRTLVTFEGKFCSDPQPGDLVRFYLSFNSLGIIVKIISENQVEVLWSNFEEVNPARMINYSEIGRKLFQVEPLPQGALPFYLDHRFGGDKVE